MFLEYFFRNFYQKVKSLKIFRDYEHDKQLQASSGEFLKDIFKQIVKIAMDLGLVKIDEVCVDGTKIEANANTNRKRLKKR